MIQIWVAYRVLTKYHYTFIICYHGITMTWYWCHKCIISILSKKNIKIILPNLCYCVNTFDYVLLNWGIKMSQTGHKTAWHFFVITHFFYCDLIACIAIAFFLLKKQLQGENKNISSHISKIGYHWGNSFIMSHHLNISSTCCKYVFNSIWLLKHSGKLFLLEIKTTCEIII